MGVELVTETERLEFRKFSVEDAAGFFHLNNDPEVLRYTGDVAFVDESEARNFLLAYGHYALYDYGRWSVYLKETGKYLGFCGLKFLPEKEEVDLGFRILRAHRNKGFATEEAKEALRLGFGKYRLRTIVGRAMEEDLASHCVLEKLGMTKVGTFEEKTQVWVQYEISN